MITHELCGLALTLGLLTTPLAAGPRPARHTEGRPVDLVICLDTSGSMNGLINAARQNIWAIVNDLALAEPSPELRIALLTFGNNGNAKEEGWVAIQTPFTDDLDLVSEKLFALTTNGGEEYVGRVLQTSLDRLSWSADPAALKMIVVAGNEAADQDPEVDFRGVCRRAIAGGVMINSIYCGNPSDQLAPTWREVATLADGNFAAIDHNQGPAITVTPFDKQINALGTDLNATYLPFGTQGHAGQSNQVTQDKNAANLNAAAAAQRAMTKASCNYSCARWDLVDAVKDEKFDLAALKPADLPEAMQKMTLAEQRDHIAEMGARRAKLQEQITELTQQRQAWVAEELKKKAVDPSQSFDFAVRSAVRAQAEAKGFRLGGAAVSPTPEVPDGGGVR